MVWRGQVTDSNIEGGNPRADTSSAIETVLSGYKPPWRPKVAGYVALILVAFDESLERPKQLTSVRDCIALAD